MEPSDLATMQNGQSCSNSLITNPKEMIAAGLIKVEDLQPGDPYYRLIIRDYYLQKTKKPRTDHFGSLVGFV